MIRFVLAALALAFCTGCGDSLVATPARPAASVAVSPAQASSSAQAASAPAVTASPALSPALPRDAPPPSAAPDAQANSVPAATPQSALPRSRLPGGGLREITFDDVKFDLAKGAPFQRSLLTSAIEALSGQRVRVRGYILPSFQQEGITQFVLVRDNMQCCFGPGAALYDCIVVQMLPERSTRYTVRPVAVTGTFTIHEWRDEFSGKHVAIYKMDGESVE